MSARAKNAPFAQGDVVRLNSGGPPMTVASVEEGKVVCWWHGADDILTADFPPSMLWKEKPAR